MHGFPELVQRLLLYHRQFFLLLKCSGNIKASLTLKTTTRDLMTIHLSSLHGREPACT